MKRNRFMTYHPVINFAYFTAVIVFAVILFHPLAGAISLAGACSYALLLNGKKAARFMAGIPLVVMLLVLILNPLFVHKGVSVLFMIGDIQFTKEAVVYGASSALMTGAVIMWFYCYGLVMTSDRFMAVFGRIAPASSLVFSMVLRFLPRFTDQAARIDEAQRGLLVEAAKTAHDPRADIGMGPVADPRAGSGADLGADPGAGSGETPDDGDKTAGGTKRGTAKKDRVKRTVGQVSMLTTWALENSIETADSMRARGYGLPGRTNYSGFKMRKKDAVMMAFLAVICISLTAGRAAGNMSFYAYPVIVTSVMDMREAAMFIVYSVMCWLPALMMAEEEIEWKRSRSRI